MNPYKVLGITPSASQEEIRLAYRKKAKEFHPDINKSKGAPRRFKRINQAYEILKKATEEEKRLYREDYYAPEVTNKHTETTQRTTPKQPTPEEMAEQAEKEARRQAYRERQAVNRQRFMEKQRKLEKERQNAETLDNLSYFLAFKFLAVIVILWWLAG